MGMAMMGSGAGTGEERAREAAEAAINSPLLEDVHLSGARGILVNVSAGMNMAIGEFEEVGTTIRQFSSEDAQVVVGTVIDPDLDDELRVTVVATGLGQPQQQAQRPRSVARTADGQVDYDQMDRPTVMRTNKRAAGDDVNHGSGKDKDIDYLDIPAFLRRQAD